MLKREGKDNLAVQESAVLPARVILTGYRATGKSVVGAQLARQIGYRFIDTDDELVSSMDCSLAEYIREHGWSSFRKLERELLGRLSWMNQVIVATGGGAVLHKPEWQELRKGSLVIWLTADAHTISERLRDDPVSVRQRPSLTGNGTHEEVASVLAEREASYREGSDMAIDTTDKTPEEIANMIEQYIIDREEA